MGGHPDMGNVEKDVFPAGMGKSPNDPISDSCAATEKASFLGVPTCMPVCSLEPIIAATLETNGCGECVPDIEQKKPVCEDCKLACAANHEWYGGAELVILNKEA